MGLPKSVPSHQLRARSNNPTPPKRSRKISRMPTRRPHSSVARSSKSSCRSWRRISSKSEISRTSSRSRKSRRSTRVTFSVIGARRSTPAVPPEERPRKEPDPDADESTGERTQAGIGGGREPAPPRKSRLLTIGLRQAEPTLRMHRTPGLTPCIGSKGQRRYASIPLPARGTIARGLPEAVLFWPLCWTCSPYIGRSYRSPP